MPGERKRKYEQLYEEEVADTTYSNRSFSRKAVPFLLKYAGRLGFITGLLLFASGIAGEVLGLTGYSFYGGSRGVNTGVHFYPYWFNCVYGIALTLLCYKSTFRKRK